MDKARVIKFLLAGVGIILLAITIFLLFFNGTTRIINRPNITDTSKVPFSTETPSLTQNNQNGSPSATDTGTAAVETTQTLGKFRQLSVAPVAGYTSWQLTKTEALPASGVVDASNPNQTVTTKVTVPIIRFAQAKNGYLYDAEIDETTVTRTQLTNTFIANVAEAMFDGIAHVALRYASPQTESIQTYDATVPEKPAAPNVCSTPLTNDLKRGNQGDAVKTVQTFLHYINGNNLSADGNFGSGTEKAVAEFQVSNNLAETKIVDQPTRDLIATQCATLQQKINEAAMQPVQLQGSFLQSDILEMIPLQKGGAFLLAKTANGSQGITRIAGKNKNVFSSPLTEWLPYDIGANQIAIATKPSGLVAGYAYYFNIPAQTYTKIAGDINGLTILPNNDGSRVLVGGILPGKGLRLGSYDNSTKQTQTSTIATLPEKCAFKTPTVVYCGVPQNLPTGALYPDDWYKGIVGFTDNLIRIDLTTGITTTLEQPTDLHSFDYTDLSFDKTGRYLLFINKKDGILWSYDTEL